MQAQLRVIKMSTLQNILQLPRATLVKIELICGHFWNHELELGKLQDHVHLALLGSNALLCKNLLQSCYLREKGLIGTLICLFFYPRGSNTHTPPPSIPLNSVCLDISRGTTHRKPFRCSCPFFRGVDKHGSELWEWMFRVMGWTVSVLSTRSQMTEVPVCSLPKFHVCVCDIWNSLKHGPKIRVPLSWF